jgi:hypothetical protein
MISERLVPERAVAVRQQWRDQRICFKARSAPDPPIDGAADPGACAKIVVSAE